MLKKIFKSVSKSFGYTIITNEYFNRLFDIDRYSEFDCLYLLKDIYRNKKNLVFFDIGANTGQTSIKLISTFIEPDIYSFEPVKSTFDALSKIQIAYPSIKLYQLAMGDKPGRAEISHRENSQLNSLVPALNKAGNDNSMLEIIEITTVDEFAKQNNVERIHLLKSDTEGFEKQVIAGAKNMLTAKRIDTVYIEVGFKSQDIQHSYWLDIINIMEGYGYHFAGLFETNYGDKINLEYANALFLRTPDLNSY